MNMNRRLRVSLGGLIAASTVLLFLVAAAPQTDASHCSPGWTSCTGWSDTGGCCWAGWSNQMTEQVRYCDTWELNPGSHCTYSVVVNDAPEYRCIWELC